MSSSHIYSSYQSSTSLESKSDLKETISQSGVKKLSSIELLSLLLGTQSRQSNKVYALAKQIYNESNGLRGLGYTTYNDLCSIKGIGPIKAGRILAGIELGLRVAGKIQHNSSPALNHNPEQLWINQSRQLWLNETTTVLATVDESFNEAITLSLDQGIEDSQQFGSWIKRLILHSGSSIHPQWCLLFLRSGDQLKDQEIRNCQKLYELTQCLDLSLRAIFIINHTQYWRVSLKDNDQGDSLIEVIKGDQINV